MTQEEIQAKVDFYLGKMEEWASGHRSWTYGPNPPYTPEAIAIMDAQEVVKYAAALQGYSALLNRP